MNNTTYGSAVLRGVRISSQQTSVMDFSSSVRNWRLKSREESPLTLPSIGTASQSSLFVVNDETPRTKVLEIRKEIHGERYFGAFSSSQRNRKRPRSPLRSKRRTKNNPGHRLDPTLFHKNFLDYQVELYTPIHQDHRYTDADHQIVPLNERRF